jgi:tol-pal system protein YbgF
VKWKTSLVVVISMVAVTARAAAPVADIAAVPAATQAVAQVAPQSVVAGSPSTDTYYLLQSLREELRVLRGMVEEQGNTIRLLKQRQVDDYLDLDRRLGGLAAAGVSTQVNSPAGSLNSGARTPPSSTPPSGVTATRSVNDSEKATYEKATYEKAYSALKSGQVATAKQSFTDYLAKYPKGRYAANGYYWLGEIYMLDNQLKEAGEAFVVVVEQYPAHRKMLDASFKLGKVYHLQGKNEKAKALLNKIAVTKGSAGKLAADYLNANF